MSDCAIFETNLALDITNILRIFNSPHSLAYLSSDGVSGHTEDIHYGQ